MLQRRLGHLHAVGQHEGALEAAGGDAAVEEGVAHLVALALAPAGHGELAGLHLDDELVG